MGHFIACRKSMLADQLAYLMIRQVWRVHGTPKTIVLDRGRVFISQITKELNKCLGISLHPSTDYHTCTEGQSEIANKVVEQYLRHYVGYRQDDWEELLATAEFAYNNNDHESSETYAGSTVPLTCSQLPLPQSERGALFHTSSDN
jgi:hypothetical protein